uniref:ATP synthase subunit a n=3 Tax=Oleaceae TaxID=4144 RepID=A0A8A9WMU7_9LAMI|nr:ATP synthase subunit 6 [Osmanthus fragrans]QTT60947.1 ATP synthase subunit 6 [Osmanthus fragrans]
MTRFARIFLFDENSLNSTQSSTTISSTTITSQSQSTTTTSTESSFLSSSNSGNLNPTANWNLNDSHTEPTTTTSIDLSFPSSDTQGSYAGIFEDHPGLNPSSERIVELQSDLHAKLGELMINRSTEDVLVAAEALHGESDNIPFMEFLLNDLTINGVQGEAYTDALHLAGLVPSPLEQFAILPLIPMKIGNLYFSFTNPSLFMLLTLSLVLLLVHFVTKKGGGNSVPNAWQSLVELIYDFVPNLVNEQIGGLSGNVKQKFSPCISVTFTFSLFRNPQGMIPYSFTVTSHFLITLGLSFSLFIGITIVGFQKNGLHFLSFLLPAGVPLPLAPFLVLLELIPHCFRALSSGIRLFANMMAGHSSVKILSGSAWTMLCMNDLLYFIGDPGPLFIVLALTGLELGVAISQAHVSTISICIYLNDATNLHQSAYLFIIEQKRG